MEKIICTLGNNSKVIVETFLTEEEFWQKFQDNFDEKYRCFIWDRVDIDFEIHENDFKKLMPKNCELIQYGRGEYGNYFMHNLSVEKQKEIEIEWQISD